MQNTYMNKMLQRIADAVERWTGGSITIDVTGAGDMQGATSSSAGVHGLVPAPGAGDEGKVLSGAGTWIDAGSGGDLGDLEDVTITSPTSGESLKYDGSKWVNGNVTAELPDFIEETSGNIVTVNAAERPAKSLVVAINPVQSGSGDPSPENVRPISGWTECNVVVSPTRDDEDGTTYTVEFKDGENQLTVYGGTLDVTTGKLTVDRAMVDLGTLTWNYNSIQNFFYTILNDINLKTQNLICDRYTYVEKSWANMQNGEFGKVANSNQIRFHNDNYETPASFKAAMSGVQLVYELATPQTYQLTPTEVQMLLGTNNIWADTGEVKELKYIPQTYNDLLEEVSGVINYSTAEQNTGVKWIDGKYIFFKTFDIAGAQYSTPDYVTIANVPNIDLLIHAQCVVYEGTDGTVVPDINQRLRIVSGGDIKIYTETSWSLTSGSHLTVWYTKL